MSIATQFTFFFILPKANLSSFVESGGKKECPCDEEVDLCRIGGPGGFGKGFVYGSLLFCKLLKTLLLLLLLLLLFEPDQRLAV